MLAFPPHSSSWLLSSLPWSAYAPSGRSAVTRAEKAPANPQQRGSGTHTPQEGSSTPRTAAAPPCGSLPPSLAGRAGLAKHVWGAALWMSPRLILKGDSQQKPSPAQPRPSLTTSTAKPRSFGQAKSTSTEPALVSHSPRAPQHLAQAHSAAPPHQRHS